MMSMAGGWFFLSVCEAFELKIQGVNHDFRLPGIGSYMSEAIDQNNHVAQIGAVVMMTLMIIFVDQLFWRPIVVWSQRFKLEDSSAGDAPRSWLVDLFQYSWLLSIASRWLGRHRKKTALAAVGISTAARPARRPSRRLLHRALIGLTLTVMAGMALWGAADLLWLLMRLPIRDPIARDSWMLREDWITVLAALMASFARTTAAVLIGAAWTLPAGILIGLSPKWSHRLQPITQILASFPAPMLFPLVYFLLLVLHIPFGIGCVSLMLLGAQWYILFNVMAGASSIPSELKEGCAVFGLSRSERWKKLYLPSTFPYLVTGLITAAGGAWNATIVAEALTVGSNTIYTFGLGSMMSKASGDEKYSLLAASVVTMSLFVVFLNRLVWKRLYRLAESRYSLNV
jgi:NitT/TauT family transport system permease protein